MVICWGNPGMNLTDEHERMSLTTILAFHSTNIHIAYESVKSKGKRSWLMTCDSEAMSRHSFDRTVGEVLMVSIRLNPSTATRSLRVTYWQFIPYIGTREDCIKLIFVSWWISAVSNYTDFTVTSQLCNRFSIAKEIYRNNNYAYAFIISFNPL